MAQYKDLTGSVYGRLVVQKFLHRDKHRQAFWECLCSCGNSCEVRGQSLQNKGTRSCGCLNDEVRKTSFIGNVLAKTHGMSNHQLYSTWSTMKQRCTNPKAYKYPHYGGRGIVVCDEWDKSFVTFLNDMGERPEGTTLNRIDNDGMYCKENCEWQTPSEQNRNRRKYTKTRRLGL